jgi:predicted transcriptional regulator
MQTKRFDHFTIRYLMEDILSLEIIDAKRPVKEALAKMCAKHYSQLPVIKGKTCIGSVTFESIMCQLRKEDQRGNLGLNFMDWPVERFVEKSRFVRPDDDILKHIDWMAGKGFVLIGSSQELKSIVTNYDLVHFFKNKTEVFLLLREIETSLRYVVSQCLKKKKLKKALVSLKREHGPPPSCVDDLTMDELRQVISGNWNEFKDSLCDQKKIDRQLQKIRDLRNRVFHFRGRLTTDELDSIKKLRDNYLNLAYSFVNR